MKGIFTFLGTGSSSGVPVIGCDCSVCESGFSKNKRFRSSGLIEVEGQTFVIDMGPDFRSQALQFNIKKLDALLLTHTHYDHIAGIDEVRIFNIRQKKPLLCLLSKESFLEIKRRYYYFFKEKVSAKFDFTLLEVDQGTIEFFGVSIHFVSFYQNKMKITGFRFGDFAYISDINQYDEQIFQALKGVRKLVISALRFEKSPFHLSFEEAVFFANQVGVERAWITHVGHFLDHRKMNALLPKHIQVGYDGLKIEFLCKS